MQGQVADCSAETHPLALAFARDTGQVPHAQTLLLEVAFARRRTAFFRLIVSAPPDKSLCLWAGIMIYLKRRSGYI